MTSRRPLGEPLTKDARPLARPEAFRGVALESRDALYRVAVRMLGDAHLAEDLVQECFVRAFAQRDRFRGESHPRTWLTGILLNLCRDTLRKRAVRRWLSFSLLTGDEAQPAAPPRDDGLEVAERDAALREALGRLPHRQRAALVLVTLEGLEVAEVAEALGTSRDAVWQSLSRGRAALRRSLHGRV